MAKYFSKSTTFGLDSFCYKDYQQNNVTNSLDYCQNKNTRPYTTDTTNRFDNTTNRFIGAKRMPGILSTLLNGRTRPHLRVTSFSTRLLNETGFLSAHLWFLTDMTSSMYVSVPPSFKSSNGQLDPFSKISSILFQFGCLSNMFANVLVGRNSKT